jgi:hypothetical protein
VDGAVDAAAPAEGRIRRVHDHVDIKSRDVAKLYGDAMRDEVTLCCRTVQTSST